MRPALHVPAAVHHKAPALRARFALLAPFALFALLAAPTAALDLREASPLRGPASVFHPFPLAGIDHAVAVLENPAGLAVAPSSEFFGLVTDSDHLGDGDTAFLLKMRLVGLAYERSRPVEGLPSAGKLTVGMGRRLSRTMAFGASYAWFFSKDDDLADLSSVDFGLLVRAVPRISLAAAATGYNRPTFRGERIPRRYAAGLQAAPAGDWLLLFLEGTAHSEERLADGVAAYGLELEPLSGIVLRGRADTDGDYRVGFEYNFGQSAYGVVGLYRNDGDSDGRAGYIRLLDTAYRRGRGS
jgi:hypothetical protein